MIINSHISKRAPIESNNFNQRIIILPWIHKVHDVARFEFREKISRRDLGREAA